MNKLNNNLKTMEKQELLSYLKQELLSKLPETIEESAKEYGAIVRKREIKNAIDLINVLFIYALTDISQRMLATFAGILEIADISDQAWQKKRYNAKIGLTAY